MDVGRKIVEREQEEDQKIAWQLQLAVVLYSHQYLKLRLSFGLRLDSG